MNDDDCSKMKLIAEVTVQRFFTEYLNEVFPKQLEQLIAAHNRDVAAHTRQIREAVRAESSRVKLWLMGVIFTGGLGGGIGIAKFFFGS